MTLNVVGWLLDADSPHERAIAGAWIPSKGGMTAEPLVLRVDAILANERLREALTELRDRISGHPAYADLTEAEELETGGDTAEWSYLVRVANGALTPNF